QAPVAGTGGANSDKGASGGAWSPASGRNNRRGVAKGGLAAEASATTSLEPAGFGRALSSSLLQATRAENAMRLPRSVTAIREHLATLDGSPFPRERLARR